MRAILGHDEVVTLAFVDVEAVDDVGVLEFLMNFDLFFNKGQGIGLLELLEVDDFDGEPLFGVGDEGALEDSPGVALAKDIDGVVLILADFGFPDALAALDFEGLLEVDVLGVDAVHVLFGRELFLLLHNYITTDSAIMDSDEMIFNRRNAH